jgi:hypothetical protein
MPSVPYARGWLPLLRHELAIVKPRYVVCMGSLVSSLVCSQPIRVSDAYVYAKATGKPLTFCLSLSDGQRTDDDTQPETDSHGTSAFIHALADSQPSGDSAHGPPDSQRTPARAQSSCDSQDAPAFGFTHARTDSQSFRDPRRASTDSHTSLAIPSYFPAGRGDPAKARTIVSAITRLDDDSSRKGHETGIVRRRLRF